MPETFDGMGLLLLALLVAFQLPDWLRAARGRLTEWRYERAVAAWQREDEAHRWAQMLRDAHTTHDENRTVSRRHIPRA